MREDLTVNTFREGYWISIVVCTNGPSPPEKFGVSRNKVAVRERVAG